MNACVFAILFIPLYPNFKIKGDYEEINTNTTAFFANNDTMCRGNDAYPSRWI